MIHKLVSLSPRTLLLIIQSSAIGIWIVLFHCSDQHTTYNWSESGENTKEPTPPFIRPGHRSYVCSSLIACHLAFIPAMVHILIQNAPVLGHTPPPRTATAARKVHIMILIRVAMNPVIINVIFWMFVWPKGILTIDSIEAYVWSVICTVGEFANFTPAICHCAIGWVDIFAFIPFNVKMFFAQHCLKDICVVKVTLVLCSSTQVLK